jgi:hypothetical protein
MDSKEGRCGILFKRQDRSHHQTGPMSEFVLSRKTLAANHFQWLFKSFAAGAYTVVPALTDR